ncbi:hypothetical protein BDV12DRAFT_182701 [Aspergillus spectabilis]
MIGHAYYQLWRPPRRVASASGLRVRSALYGSPLCGSQPHCCKFTSTSPKKSTTVDISRWGDTRPGPTDSQLLRFALTKDSHQPHPHFSESSTELRLKEIFLDEWPSDLLPTPLAFEHCEQQDTYGDILAFINGLAVKLKGYQSSDRHFVHYLGIYYACLVLSEPALEYHLWAYSRDETLGMEESQRIVRALLRSLHALSFDDPKRDTSKLLRLVTGEAGSDAPNLHRVLYWSKGWGSEAESKVECGTATAEYLSLLVLSKSDTIRQEVFDNFLKTLIYDLEFLQFPAAYNYARSLIDAGDSSGALTVLKQLSKIAGNTLPDINQSRGLNSFLRVNSICEELSQLAGDDEYAKILSVQLHHIERSLGIEWQREKNVHSAVSSPSRVASEQPLLTMDGDSFGYESPERLVEGIRTLGSSKSEADLSKVADLLDEYEGDLIPVTVYLDQPFDAEFYWAPQRSPVELRARSSSTKVDGQHNELLSNLGLVRVTTSNNGDPLASGGTLHLIQLGYLLQKQPSASGEGLDASPELKELGYLVTWDRILDRFLVVFTGTGRDRIEPTTDFHNFDAPHSLKAIMGLDCLQHRKKGWDVRFPQYSLELDPSPNLVLDAH